MTPSLGDSRLGMEMGYWVWGWEDGDWDNGNEIMSMRVG